MLHVINKDQWIGCPKSKESRVVWKHTADDSSSWGISKEECLVDLVLVPKVDFYFFNFCASWINWTMIWIKFLRFFFFLLVLLIFICFTSWLCWLLNNFIWLLFRHLDGIRSFKCFSWSLLNCMMYNMNIPLSFSKMFCLHLQHSSIQIDHLRCWTFLLTIGIQKYF